MFSTIQKVIHYIKRQPNPQEELLRCFFVNVEKSVELNLTWVFTLSYLWYTSFTINNNWVTAVTYTSNLAFIFIKIAGIIRTINMERKLNE